MDRYYNNSLLPYEKRSLLLLAKLSSCLFAQEIDVWVVSYLLHIDARPDTRRRHEGVGIPAALRRIPPERLLVSQV